MLILGIGTNCGDRLANLRQALTHLQASPNITVHHVSPVYESDAMLPDNAPKAWNQGFFNAAISCSTTLSPFELLKLVKDIERRLGRIDTTHWAPRIIDIDILMWGTQQINTEELVIPHYGLYDRPFALWPIMDLYSNWDYPRELLDHWGSRFSGHAPYQTRQMPFRIDGSKFVGILNITPDSFSDGGCYYEGDLAVRRAKQLFASGAEVLDIGAESTCPSSKPVSADDEWRRLEKPLTAILDLYADQEFKPKISVDTRHSTTAAKAIALGVDWINDVSGFNDPKMIEVVGGNEVEIVCMHSLSIPPAAQKIIPISADPVTYLLEWAQKKMHFLEQKGIDASKIIIDVGIGFGKSPEQSLALIRRAHEFKQLGVPIMVGHARKSFYKIVTSVAAEERDLETAISTIELFNRKIDFLRVHDVAYNARAVAMSKRLDSIPLHAAHFSNREEQHDLLK